MNVFRIQILEEVTVSSSASFNVNSVSVEAAAAEVLLAYREAENNGSAVILLKNGQREMLEPAQSARAEVTMLEIDEGGETLSVITTTKLRRSLS